PGRVMAGSCQRRPLGSCTEKIFRESPSQHLRAKRTVRLFSRRSSVGHHGRLSHASDVRWNAVPGSYARRLGGTVKLSVWTCGWPTVEQIIRPTGTQIWERGHTVLPTIAGKARQEDR